MPGRQKATGGVREKLIQLAHGVPGLVVLDIPIPSGGPVQKPVDPLFPVLDLLLRGRLRRQPDLTGRLLIPLCQPKQQGMCLLQVQPLDQLLDGPLLCVRDNLLPAVIIIQRIKNSC